MNKTQKGAWIGLVLVAFLLMIPAIDIVEKSMSTLLTHVVGYSVGLPLLILIIYLIRKIETQPGVNFDERDKLIIKKALLGSFTFLIVILGVVFVIALMTLGLEKSISITIDELSAVIYFFLVIFLFVLSLAVLIQYGRGGKDDK